MIKNNILAMRDILITLKKVCFLDSIKPNETIIKKLKYTDRMGWCPIKKSEIKRIIVGSIKAKRLSYKNVPENKAMAPIAVILGG